MCPQRSTVVLHWLGEEQTSWSGSSPQLGGEADIPQDVTGHCHQPLGKEKTKGSRGLTWAGAGTPEWEPQG